MVRLALAIQPKQELGFIVGLSHRSQHVQYIHGVLRLFFDRMCVARGMKPLPIFKRVFFFFFFFDSKYG